MLAKLARELPPAGDVLFEPKWDGFRALVFRDGDDLYLQSRDERPLLRYFPELAEPLKARCQRSSSSLVAPRMGLPLMSEVTCGGELSTLMVMPAEGVSWLPAMSVARV